MGSFGDTVGHRVRLRVSLRPELTKQVLVPITARPRYCANRCCEARLEGDFPHLETYRACVQPICRFINRYPIDTFLTKLTGIYEEDIQVEGLPLQKALVSFDRFSDGVRSWS